MQEPAGGTESPRRDSPPEGCRHASPALSSMRDEAAVCYHVRLMAAVWCVRWPRARDRGRQLHDSRRSSPVSDCSSRPFARIEPIDVLRNRDMLWLALACPTRWRCQTVGFFCYRSRLVAKARRIPLGFGLSEVVEMEEQARRR
jgi:hypothetical protein